MVSTERGDSDLQAQGASDADDDMQMVMDLLSKCKRNCETEVSCMICLQEKYSILRPKIK